MAKRVLRSSEPVLRFTLWDRQRACCAICTRSFILPDGTIVEMEVDHVLALCAGGADDLSNLQMLCLPCHRVKSAADVVLGNRHKVECALGVKGKAPPTTPVDFERLLHEMDRIVLNMTDAVSEIAQRVADGCVKLNAMHRTFDAWKQARGDAVVVEAAVKVPAAVKEEARASNVVDVGPQRAEAYPTNVQGLSDVEVVSDEDLSDDDTTRDADSVGSTVVVADVDRRAVAYGGSPQEIIGQWFVVFLEDLKAREGASFRFTASEIFMACVRETRITTLVQQSTTVFLNKPATGAIAMQHGFDLVKHAVRKTYEYEFERL